LDNKNELVVKANRLVEASYRLTLAEQRLILMAITEARRTQKGIQVGIRPLIAGIPLLITEADELEIKAIDFAKTFNLPSNQAYEQIQDASKNLMQRQVTLHGTDPKTGLPDELVTHWVSSVRYVEGAGTLYLRFAHEIVPYITRLEAEFTSYKLEQIAKMTSVYSIRLYELLLQWGCVGQREIEMAWLREIMLIEQHQYKAIKDFKRYVIDIALAQINEHSDLMVGYTQRKTGRNVSHLMFTFAPKKQAKKKQELARECIEKHALPGETWGQAEKRLQGLLTETA